ncbi:hypothetical protein BH10PSE17_BH10PSE17_15670 [soil metagenome]
MSFRYKSALLSLISLVAIYGWYFLNWLIDHKDHVHFDGPVRLGGTVVLVTVVQVVGHMVIARTSSDRYGAMDERELGFDRRATSAGYYLMIIGTLAAIATLHFGAGPGDLANAALLAIVIAECSRQAIFVGLHHRVA